MGEGGGGGEGIGWQTNQDAQCGGRLLYCLAGCLSTIVWTHAILGVLYACLIFLYLHLLCTIEHVSPGQVL